MMDEILNKVVEPEPWANTLENQIKIVQDMIRTYQKYHASEKIIANASTRLEQLLEQQRIEQDETEHP